MAEDYDLETLKRGLVSIEANITALQEALSKEMEKKEEYDQFIAAAETVEKMKGR